MENVGIRRSNGLSVGSAQAAWQGDYLEAAFGANPSRVSSSGGAVGKSLEHCTDYKLVQRLGPRTEMRHCLRLRFALGIRRRP